MLRRYRVLVLPLLVGAAACGGVSEADGDAATRATGAGTTTRPSASSTADEPEPTVTTAAPVSAPALRRVGSPADPLRFLLLGDSVTATLIPSFEDALARLETRGAGPATLIQGSGMGFGLGADVPMRVEGAEGDALYPRWRATWTELVAEEDPDVAVLMVGTWDARPRLVDGAWLEPGTPAWRNWYTGVVEEAIAILSARGARVSLVTGPCLAITEGGEVEHPNGVVRAVAARLAAEGAPVGAVDLEAAVCPDGRFEAHLPTPDGTPLLVRRDDGVHFVDQVAPAVMGPLLADLLARDWRL